VFFRINAAAAFGVRYPIAKQWIEGTNVSTSIFYGLLGPKMANRNQYRRTAV